MTFLFDALKHLLASDAKTRREGLAALVGRAFGAEPVALLPDPERPYDVVHYPKVAGRPFAVTMTLGLGEAEGRELVALTLADRREGDDRFARMLLSVADASRGEVVGLPEGALGRSAHASVVLTEAWPVPELLERERIVGGRLDLVVPITPREAEWIAGHGADAFVARMREQRVDPWADRPAGLVDLA